MSTHALPHARAQRLALNRLGLWLFILSEAMIFAALLAARFSLQGVNRPESLNQPIGLTITSLLLLSSLTAYRAERLAETGDRRGFLSHTLLTILLGIVFLVGVGIEWSQAFLHFPPSSPFGTVFFAMTGMHAFHVLSGVLILALVYLNGRRGAYDDNPWGVEAAAKYWHFVDVVWVFFYPALYLVA